MVHSKSHEGAHKARHYDTLREPWCNQLLMKVITKCSLLGQFQDEVTHHERAKLIMKMAINHGYAHEHERLENPNPFRIVFLTCFRPRFYLVFISLFFISFRHIIPHVSGLEQKNRNT